MATATTKTALPTLGTTQVKIITALGTDKASVAQIASALSLSTDAVRSALYRLEDKGLARVAKTDKETGIQFYATNATARKAAKASV